MARRANELVRALVRGLNDETLLAIERAVRRAHAAVLDIVGTAAPVFRRAVTVRDWVEEG